MEILVHNLSHSDLVLGVRLADGSTSVARPKFSCFKAISEAIYADLTRNGHKLAAFHPYSRSEARFLNECDQVAVGYDLMDNSIPVTDASSLRFRSDDHADKQQVQITSVYFPLIATLIPKWIRSTTDGGSAASAERLVVLVSGRGQPQDERAKYVDNSTKFTAKLIAMFLKKVYNNLGVELIHSQANLFRYDENIVFVKQQLLPAMNKHRDVLVSKHGSQWKEYFRVTLSFADGSTARISAINASLRHFRPSYMHFWVLKTFWRELKICEEDIEWHSFEEVATDSAVSLRDISDPLIRLVVQEMESFRAVFTGAAIHQDNDLMSFWLRKTRKPVLAVLLVQKPGHAPKLYRGTNMEVSMPTGSLCAERNVIGTALADDVGLMRQHIKFIAVYSVNLQAIDKQAAPSVVELPNDTDTMSADLAVIDPPASSPAGCIPRSPTMHHKRSILNINSTTLVSKHSAEELCYDSDQEPLKKSRISLCASVEQDVDIAHSRQKNVPFYSPGDPSSARSTTTPATVPIMTTIAVDESDMNPLKPCGSCNEWLKKIAEVNPQVQVITFTDAFCRGIYCEPVGEY